MLKKDSPAKWAAIALGTIAVFIGMGNMLDEQPKPISFVCNGELQESTCWDSFGNLTGQYGAIAQHYGTSRITIDEHRRIY